MTALITAVLETRCAYSALDQAVRINYLPRSFWRCELCDAPMLRPTDCGCCQHSACAWECGCPTAEQDPPEPADEWDCAICGGGLASPPQECGCCGSAQCSVYCGCKGLYEDYWCIECNRAHGNPCVGAAEFEAGDQAD